MSGPERGYAEAACVAQDAPAGGAVEGDEAWWSAAAGRMAQGQGAAVRGAAAGRSGRAFAGAMSRRAQAADVRGAWAAGVPGGGDAGAAGPMCEAAPEGGVEGAAEPAVDGPVQGPVGPDDVELPVSPDMPLMYKPEGGGVQVLPMEADAPAAGWQAVEPEERTWPLYFALYLERTDPGEVRYGELGPVVGDVFGPVLLASLGPLPGQSPWQLPGGMPGGLYVGVEAHKGIGAYYKASHGGRDDIFLNDLSIASIALRLRDLDSAQYGHLRPDLGTAIRPDITDATLRHVYEIKPWRSAKTGAAEARQYVQAFARVGFAIRLGVRGVPGTKGRIAGPGGWFSFDVMEEGVIGYLYKQKGPVPELLPLPHAAPAKEPTQDPERRIFEWKYWEEVTGLTGAALLTYLIISEGSRIIPLRNAIPIP